MGDIADRRIIETTSTAPGYTLAQAGAFLRGQSGRRLTDDECAAIPRRFQSLALLLGIDWTLAFAESCVETDNYRFTGQVPLGAKNVAGIGAINDGTSYLTYADWDTGIAAYYVHLLAWLDRLDLCARLGVNPAALDPRLGLVAQARAAKGPVRTWRDLGGRWAVREGVPWQQQATMAGNYGSSIAARHAALAATTAPQGGASMAPTITDKIIGVNYWPGRAGQRVQAVVLHVAEGGRAGVASWFRNPASEASAHYLVNKDGSVWRFVREEDTAWANGKVQNPNLADPLVAEWVRTGINPNRCTVAIETERTWQERLTPAQLASVCWLCADIHRRYGLPTDGSRLLGHNEIDSVDRARCPSLSPAEWAAIVAAVGGAAAAPAPPPADTARVENTIDPATGEPVTTIRWGGRAKRVIATNLVDLGISLIGMDDATYDRSIRANAFLDYQRR